MASPLPPSSPGSNAPAGRVGVCALPRSTRNPPTRARRLGSLQETAPNSATMPAPTPRTAAAIRQDFLDFFREKGHTVVPSAPLVPEDDPTLLFINAGMNPFKDVFLGTGTRPFVRAADTQKCLRVSGKHNDLDEVGLDTYHHTFFEMLGNWSFGDYFKADAIRWAWELLVTRWGLDPARLYATVHAGDEALGLGPDDEAAALWTSETTLAPENILYQSSKDNFWMMGDTGPCGPCTEIHVDLRDARERAIVPGSALVNKDDPRVMEIWNLVFIQYNAIKEGDATRLEALAARHVDTGMGFERVCAVLQGKSSNYDTDLFAPILAETARLAGLSGRGSVSAYDALDEHNPAEKAQRIAMRVVADHVRTLVFAITDGAAPSNTGRGYVVRRILRRAVRYGYQGLGLREPFLYALVPAVVREMGDAFPEIVASQANVARTVRAEEEAFLKTLGTGIELFEALAPLLADPDSADRAAASLLDRAYPGQTSEAALADVRAHAGTVPGEVVFLLHDTYGFPSDLTAVMARERGLNVDEARFDALMTEQRERARAAAGFSVDYNAPEAQWQAHGDADDRATDFTGYDALETTGAHVLRSRTLGDDDRHEIVLDRTPFYAESGGQVGDTGTLAVGGETVRVLDTVKGDAGQTVHVVDRMPQDRTGAVTARVDADRRQRIVRHHTATHLLQAALRDLLGEGIQQRGSRVEPDRLRFDFASPERVTPEQQRAVEARVNALVLANLPVVIDRDVPIAEARQRGAMALFGEKYGDAVRVVTVQPLVDDAGNAIGEPLPASVELCGGTHAARTGEVGLFRIVSEGSVSSGVRRVEAVAGEAALAWLSGQMAELDAARGLFKGLPEGLASAVGALQDETKALARDLATLRAQQAAAGLDAYLDAATDVDGITLVVARIDGASADALRDLAEGARERLDGAAVAVFGSVDGEKVALAASATDAAVQAGIQAGTLIGRLAKRVGGGGGGRPTLATAGGRDPEALDAALAAAADDLRALRR